MLYSHTWNSDGNLGPGFTRPAKATKVRGVLVRARGAFKAAVREVSGGPAKCAAGKRAWQTSGQGSTAGR